MTDLTPELLARHDGWLRALIRRLVDDGQADDVLQEVWGRALKSPPRDRAALPAWLATVTRRVVSRRARTDRRRAAREREVARAADTAAGVDPAELVARVEERQHVARAVLELDEPFRTVVLLRYFEDEDTATIATRLGVPVATVRTRLHRAHQKLRERFERDRGADWRGQLAMLCVPLGADQAKPAAPAAASKLAAVAAVPLLLAVGIWWATRGGAGETPVPAPSDPGQAASRTALEADDAERATLATPATGDEPVDSPGPPPAVAEVAIQGELLDYAGRPIPRAPIVLRPGTDRDAGPVRVGLTDLRGRFAVTVPARPGRLVAGGGDWATLRSWGPLHGGALTAADDALIVAAPRVRVAGRVVDRAGGPVAGERVEVRFTDVHGFPYPTAGTSLEHPDARTTTAPDGRFVLDDVPGFPRADLRVGMFRAVVPMPPRDTDDLVVVLGTGRMPAPERTGQPSRRPVQIEGIVRDAAARPVPGALVVVPGEPNTASTDERGGFTLGTMAPPDAPVPLVIGAQDHVPEQRDVWFENGADSAWVDVVLREGDRAVAGRVVDEQGRPQPGLTVALTDATPFDLSSFVTRYAERPDAHAFGAHDRTGPAGEFRIPRVLPRPYRLRVFDVDTGFAWTTGPLDPETPAEVEVPADRHRTPLAVRVVDHRGRAVAGADVEVSVVQLHVESSASWGGTASSTSFLVIEPGGPTDGDGVCRLDAAPAGELRVGASKPGWIPVERDFPADRTGDVELTMLRQCPIRVDVADLEQQNLKLVLFDAQDRELEVRPAWRGARRPAAWSFGVVRGRSVVAGVAETVARAELRELVGGRLVRSMPVAADPSRVTVLDFPSR